MQTRILSATALLLVSALSSCAAILTGTTDDVEVVPLEPSEAQGWTVTAGKQSVALGEPMVKLSKRTEQMTFTHESGETHSLKMPRKFQGGMILVDMLFTPGFGLSGIVIDAATGAFYALPETLTVDTENWVFVGHEDVAEIGPEQDAESPEPEASVRTADSSLPDA